MWLSLDNTEVKKANMSWMFRVNLAFYHNINTSKCVDYNIDFVAIKQGHTRRRPLLLVKSHPKYGVHRGMHSGYLAEFMWRRKYMDDDKFLQLIKDINDCFKQKYLQCSPTGSH